MELKEEEGKLLTKYLLGDLSESEKVQIEARFFVDNEYYENLLIAEDELIYNYLRGACAAHERNLFETQIAVSPKRREKVQFIKSLMSEATAANIAAIPTLAVLPETKERTSWWQPMAAFLTTRNGKLQLAMMTAILLLTIAGFWLWTQARRMNSELQLAQAQYEKNAHDAAQREQTEKQKTELLQKEKDDLTAKLRQEETMHQQLLKEKERLENQAENSAAQSKPIPFTLEQGIPRSESEVPKVISIPHRARWIQLTLDLGSDDGSGKYRAEFNTRGGTLVWSQNGLSSKQMAWGKAVVLNLPTGIFRNSEYDLTLKRAVGKGQIEDVGYYYFKVVKQ